MSGFWIALAALAVLASWWAWTRRRSPRSTPSAVTPVAPTTPVTQRTMASPLPAAATPQGSAPEIADAPAPPRVVPEPLAALSMRTADGLPMEKSMPIAAALREIPRPPRALHQMVSLDFVSHASSSEIADVVMSEPLVAAKVMAKIHSPIFGLRQPVTKIGQAMTFLGTQSVRNVCLRYLLAESFKTDNAHAGNIFDTLGEASTLGSEMCLRLAQKLGLPDPGSMMTHVLLSFTGHLAATILQVDARPGVARTLPASLLQRVYGQQQELGLPGSEIGRMLMREWKLEQALVDDVAAIDPVLVTPAGAFAPERAVRLGVCYLSARLAERLASKQIDDLEPLDELMAHDPDFHHLHGYLALPAARGWREALRAPEFMAGLGS